MHARPNAVASLRCQENQQNSYIARLIVRHESKLAPLGRAHHIFCSAVSPGGAPQESGRVHQKVFGFRAGILYSSAFKLLLAPLRITNTRGDVKGQRSR